MLGLLAVYLMQTRCIWFRNWNLLMVDILINYYTQLVREQVEVACVWVRYLAENKKIIMVGIPGVGKTTLLQKLKR